MNVVKRNELKDQIAAGEARVRAREDATFLDRAGEKAIEAKDRFTGFAREHPIATVAGGLAIGVLISGLFRNSPTRKAGRKAAARTSTLANVGAELAATWFAQATAAAAEARRTGVDQLEDAATSVGKTSRKLGREAGHLAHEAGDSARELKRDALKLVSRALKGRIH